MQKLCYLVGFLAYFKFLYEIFIAPFYFLSFKLPNHTELSLEILLENRKWRFYRGLLSIPPFIHRFHVSPRWANVHYTDTAKFTAVIVRFARLRASYDLVLGHEFVWLATGDRKAHANYKYRNTLYCARAWTVFTLTVGVARLVYGVRNGVPWSVFISILRAYFLW